MSFEFYQVQLWANKALNLGPLKLSTSKPVTINGKPFYVDVRFTCTCNKAMPQAELILKEAPARKDTTNAQ